MMSEKMIVTIEDFKTDYRRRLFADEIIKSINDENAKEVYFVGTQQSKSLLEVLTSKSYEFISNFHFIEITRPDSFNSTFSIVISKLQEIIDEDMLIDLTFGSKILSFALTIIGKNKNAQFKYNQKILDIIPDNYTLEVIDTQKDIYDLEVVVEYFNNHQFHLALNYLNRSDIDANLKKVLNSLILFYHNIDHFIYDDIINLDELSSNESVTIRNNILEKNIDSLDYLKKNDFDFVCYNIANLINNAHRRFDEENYDDAISRLYSATELIFTEKLKDYNIKKNSSNTKAFDRLNIPTNIRNNIKGYVSVYNQYRLLKYLNDPIALTYSLYEKKGVNIIHLRNNTHINHGLLNVSHDHYIKLEESVITIARQLIYDIDTLINKTRFPRIELKDNKYIIIR